MSNHQRMEFGYCPPSGERGAETIRPREFVSDMHKVLDIAAQGFSSFWISDHLMFGAKYRLEAWTQLTWLAARYPNVQLGHMVLCNSFRNPALTAWTFIDRSQANAVRRAAQIDQRDFTLLAGDPAAIRDRLTELAEMGFSLCHLVFPNFPETDDMRLFMNEVMPHFA